MDETIDTMTKCMTAAMLSSPQPRTHRQSTLKNVALQTLEAQRISGNKNIVPDSDAQTTIAAAGRAQIVGSFKLCINVLGAVDTIIMLHSTGFNGYDRNLVDGIREWKYRPFTVDGKPTPVCYGNETRNAGLTGLSELCVATAAPPLRPAPAKAANPSPSELSDLEIGLSFALTTSKPRR